MVKISGSRKKSDNSEITMSVNLLERNYISKYFLAERLETRRKEILNIKNKTLKFMDEELNADSEDLIKTKTDLMKYFEDMIEVRLNENEIMKKELLRY